MKKAYCVFEGFNNDAKKIIENAGIELTINNSKNRPNGEELISLLKEYDIIILGVFSKLTADMIQYVKKPKIIATLSVGLDHIDKSFFESPLVTVVNIKTANAISVAEHIFSLILMLNKRGFESNHLVIEGNGHRNNVHERPDDISNKILGLVGCGNITAEVIKIANVFNMKIKCYTKNPDKHTDMLDKGVEFLFLDEVLQESDIINVSIPLNNETRNLISKDKIKLMKSTATFINTSRTEVVDTEALIEYADSYDTFYVGLDIDVNEYKDLLSKYRKNVVITPHIAGISKQAVYRMDVELAENIVNHIKNF
ncbi:MAG: hypothetical protein IJN50_01805 [Clostridia bacterium]|nr:hypothetical protein [Clostridia bacterium]